MTAAAIRVLKRGPGRERHAIHLLVDAGRTYCGLATDDLQVVKTLGEGDPISEVEACLQCRRIKDRTPMPASQAAGRIISAPQAGRLRKTGPLYHGTGHHRTGHLR